MARAPYKLKDGTVVPSVTTITGRFKNGSPLIWWAAKQGQANPDVPVREALYGGKEADIGTAVHALIERFISTGERPTKMDVRSVGKFVDNADFTIDHFAKIESGMEAFFSWWDAANVKIIGQERRLVHPGYKFAGRPDAWGYLGDVPVLIDFKTSKAVYSDYLLQLAAYAVLLMEGQDMDDDYDPPLFTAEQFHILRFSKENGNFSQHAYSLRDISKSWELFDLYLKAYPLSKEIDKMVSQ